MIQGSAGCSMSKIKRQLQFDSAARYQQSTEKHQLITPQSLQMLLNSSHGPEIDNCEDQVPLSSGKKTPIGQRKEIQREYLLENSSVLGSESIYNISPFSSCKKEVLPKEKEISVAKNVGLFDYGANLKMNSLSQLNHLKQFITQKQYNESILQFQIPIKRVKRDEQEEAKENKNPSIQVKSSKGFNTEEKKIIYNSEYLQRLGLPVPETVIKQKLLEKEREMNNLKNDKTTPNIKDNNILKGNQALILTKDVSYKFPQQLERKQKVILGIQGTQQREKHQKKDLLEPLKNQEIIEKNIFKNISVINQQFNSQQSEIGNKDQKQLIKSSQEGDPNGRKQFDIIDEEEEITREQKMKKLNTETQIQLLERKAKQNGPPQPYELGNIKMNKMNEKIEYKQGKLMERFRKETEAEKISTAAQVRRQINDNDKISQKQEIYIETVRKENAQRELLFMEPQIRRTLNENEKNIIFITWVKKNLQDLNYWIQKSKSYVSLDFIEEKGYFKCIVSLSTSQKKDVIEVSSQSSSKKEARKNVMRKLAYQVIADDQLFWEGVTGRQYVENILREFKESEEGDDILRSILVEEEETQQEKYKINQSRKSEENEKANKEKFKVSKLVRQMQSSVREDKVVDALEKLSSIAALKVEISYKEASFLWNYAVQKGNLILLKIILDVIHYRKFSSQMLQALPNQQTDPQQAVSELLGSFQQTPTSKGLKNLNTVLKQSLNVTRTLLSINPFEQMNNELSSLLPPTPLSQGQPKQLEINSESFSIRNSLSLVESLNFLSVKKTVKKSVNFKSEDHSQEEQNEWPAQFFQKEKKQTFDKTGIRLSQALLRKDPYLHYLEWEDLNQLFYSLILADNPVFALQVCELIYTYAKISPDSLLGSSFFYFFNKKLILFEEFLEGTIVPSPQPGKQLPQQEGNIHLYGFLEYLGSNFEQDQFLFKVTCETGEIFSTASRQLQEGDLCSLFISKNANAQIDQQEVASCLIKECFFNENLPYFKISMVLLSDQQKRANFIKADNSRQYSLCKISSTKKLFSQSKALDSICSKVSMLHSIFLKLTLGDGYSNYQDPVRVVQEINLQSIAAIHSLNEELVDALRSASTNDLTIIQGPHNSRRTELAICIIREWLQQSNLKILVKCDSEAKSKHFFSSLHSSSVKQQQNITVSSAIPFCPNVCLMLEDGSAETFSSACKTIQSMSANMSSKVKRRLEESQIIVVSNVENMVPLKDCQFNRVILMNAEQIPEQTTWQFLVRNCNQLTLIGDITAFKRQSTQSLLAKSRNGDCSLFERLISSGISPIELKTRYIPSSSLEVNPMNNDQNKMINSLLIGTLHSSLFFSEPLKLSLSNASIAANDNNLKKVQNNGEEVLVVALKGNEELQQQEEGFHNQLEAQCIIGIVNSLMKEQNVDYNNIRIAVSTKAQEKMINSFSNQSPNISQIVKTLDKPLNQSYDFIIFSGVRSNAKGDIGEAKNPAILSTLLQYTLHKFIFVGDIDLYSLDPTWRQFILTCFSKKQIYFVNPPFSAAREEGED